MSFLHVYGKYGRVFVLVYVYGIIVSALTVEGCEFVIKKLQSQLALRLMDDDGFFYGKQITCNRYARTVSVFQPSYAQNMLLRFFSEWKCCFNTDISYNLVEKGTIP